MADWLRGGRHFAGELPLPGVATCAELRHSTVSRAPAALDAAEAMRERRAIENRLHRMRDVTVGDDFSRLRKGHGARNMAAFRRFALSRVHTARDGKSITSRRKRAG